MTAKTKHEGYRYVIDARTMTKIGIFKIEDTHKQLEIERRINPDAEVMIDHDGDIIITSMDIE
jgi:hypothetical protein